MPKSRSAAAKTSALADRKQFAPGNLATFGILLCVTLAAYLPALRGGLLWDDTSYVTPPALRSLHGLWRIWFDLGAADQYYPLVNSVFWFEYRLWGENVLGYHLVNILLHAGAAFLVILLVRRLRLPGAWLAGLLFTLHPVCVESVAWITELKNTLSAVFYLAAGLLYLRFDETRGKRPYFVGLGLFVLALASKTTTVVLPAALLVVLWWMRGRIAWRRDGLPLAPWFGIAILSGLVTTYVERVYAGASGAGFSLSPVQHLLLAGREPWFYASKLFWPANLTFFYPRWKIDPADWWQYLFPIGLAAVAIGLVLLARRNRGPLAAFLIFVGSLAPVLGFVNVYYFRYSYVADHFQYLASLGILIPMAALAAKLAGRRVGLLVVLSLCLAGLTFRQSTEYSDLETLYRETLVRNPDAFLAHDNLGNLLFEEPGRRAEAVSHFEDAIRANPDYWEAHVSLGNALLEMPGRQNDAVAEYQTAARLAPEALRTHTNLGNGLLLAGRVDEAIEQFHEALRIQPASAAAHRDLAAALTRFPDRLPDAVAEYQAALKIDPDFAEAHNDLGHVLALMPGRLPDAIAEFQAAIRIQPDYWGAHSNLGTALVQIPGRLPDAIAEYQTALRLRPDLASSHSNLAYALSLAPDRLADAASEYRRALEIDPNDARSRYNLAAVLAKMRP